MKKSWWLHIYHTTDVQSSQSHHLPNCPWLLSIPIIFSHMYTLGLRQRGVYFLFLYRTTEVLWASHKACHIPKRPENFPMAVTCKGMTDRLPVRRSGDTSAMKIFILVWSSACPWCFIPKQGAMCCIFQQGCFVQTVGELGKNKCRKLLDQLKWVEVMGRAWVQEQRGDGCCPQISKNGFTVMSSWRIAVSFLFATITLDVSETRAASEPQCWEGFGKYTSLRRCCWGPAW